MKRKNYSSLNMVETLDGREVKALDLGLHQVITCYFAVDSPISKEAWVRTSAFFFAIFLFAHKKILLDLCFNGLINKVKQFKSPIPFFINYIKIDLL